MPISALTSREAVLAALDEFDHLGREAFLRKYGFGGVAVIPHPIVTHATLTAIPDRTLSARYQQNPIP